VERQREKGREKTKNGCRKLHEKGNAESFTKTKFLILTVYQTLLALTSQEAWGDKRREAHNLSTKYCVLLITWECVQ
jgi:hypothetical protein